jgi:hypothetical protein
MRVLKSLLILAFLVLGSTVAMAHEYKVGDLEIVHPWARAQLKGTTVADGFFKIINHGTTPDRLLGISVEFAKSSQLHNMQMNGTVMQMDEMKDGIEIPAGATVELKPNAMHVMFMDVNQQLVPDAMMDGELNFQKAGKVKVKFMIEPAGTTQSMDMD